MRDDVPLAWGPFEGRSRRRERESRSRGREESRENRGGMKVRKWRPGSRAVGDA